MRECGCGRALRTRDRQRHRRSRRGRAALRRERRRSLRRDARRSRRLRAGRCGRACAAAMPMPHRAALISINDRIRTAGATESMLIVYYSGHADAEALHLGATNFALTQLEQLVRGSPAAFRLLVVDACRSGALTRVKGGKPAAAFPIALGDTLCRRWRRVLDRERRERRSAGVRHDQGLVLQPLLGLGPRRPGRCRQRRHGDDRRGVRIRACRDAARLEPHARRNATPDVSRRARRPRGDRADSSGCRRSETRRDPRARESRHARARRLRRWSRRSRGRRSRSHAPAQRPRRQVLHPRARRHTIYSKARSASAPATSTRSRIASSCVSTTSRSLRRARGLFRSSPMPSKPARSSARR